MADTLRSLDERTSAGQLVADARARIEQLTPAQVAAELASERVVLVDLREEEEREAHGVIRGAIHIPRGMLEFCADGATPIHVAELEPGRRAVLYCALGNRSALAVLTLTEMGFTDVAHLDGGFAAWRQAGGAVDKAPRIDTPWRALLVAGNPGRDTRQP